MKIQENKIDLVGIDDLNERRVSRTAKHVKSTSRRNITPLILIGTQFCIFATSVATSVLLTRQVDIKQYAAFAAWMTTFGLSYALTECSSTLVVLTASRITREIEENARSVALVRGAIASIAPAIAAQILWPEQAHVMLPVSIASSVFLSLAETSRSISLARGSIYLLVSAELLALGANAVVTVWLIHSGLGSEIFPINFAVYNLFRSTGISLATHGRFARSINAEYLQSMWTFSKRNYPLNVLNVASKNLDNLMVNQTYGSFGLGLYARGFSIILTPLIQISLALSQYISRKFAIVPEREQRALLRRLTIYSTLSGAMAMTGTWMVTPHIVPLMLGNEWAAVVPVMKILSVAGAFTLVQSPSIWLTQAAPQTGNPRPWRIGVLSLIPLSSLLIPGMSILSALELYSILTGISTYVILQTNHRAVRTPVLNAVLPCAIFAMWSIMQLAF